MKLPALQEHSDAAVDFGVVSGTETVAKGAFLAKKADTAVTTRLPEIDADKTAKIKIFSGDFEIDCTHPLPPFNTEYAVAFRTVRLTDGDDRYFTMICSSSHPPRLSQIFYFQSLKAQNILLPLGWDLIYDSAGNQFPVILFNLPYGDPLITSLHSQFQPQSPVTCVQRFLQPLLACISEMHTQGITYRAFSPTNLFIDISGAQSDYLLGQCISDPPGTMQHTVFETITAGMAAKDFRGRELSSNDIYAIGVMMVTLMRGAVPMIHMDDYEINRRKLRLSSFAALTEGLNISPTIAEPLRGLLNDNTNERWTLEHIYSWLSGRSRDKKTRPLKSRSRIDFHYQYQNFDTPGELAAVFAHHWDEAVIQTVNQDIPIWFRHGMSDELTGNSIRELQTGIGVSGGNANRFDVNLHVAFAKMLFLMNPISPIVFQNLHFTATGFGQLYARYFNQPNSLEMEQIKIIISTDLLAYWYRHQGVRTTVYNSVLQEMSLARQAITLERLEFGFERMLYVLYPDLPCLSPFFEHEFAYDMGTFLDNINSKLGKIQDKSYHFSLDRHIISFIGVRFNRNVRNILTAAMNPYSEVDAVKSQVLLLSVLQEDISRRPFPILCQYACALLEPAVQTYNNVNLQNRLRRRLKNSAQNGWLGNLLDIIEDRRLLSSDQRDYTEARIEYADSVAVLAELERTKEHITFDVNERASLYSLFLCVLISSFGILTLLF